MLTLIEACLMKIAGAKAGLDHYFVRLTFNDGLRSWYRIIEQTPEGIQSYATFYGDASWQIMGRADEQDLPSVWARVTTAETKQGYDLLFDNCEQFARSVIEGESYSTQVRSGVFIGSIIAATAFLVTRK